MRQSDPGYSKYNEALQNTKYLNLESSFVLASKLIIMVSTPTKNMNMYLIYLTSPKYRTNENRKHGEQNLDQILQHTQQFVQVIGVKIVIAAVIERWNHNVRMKDAQKRSISSASTIQRSRVQIKNATVAGVANTAITTSASASSTTSTCCTYTAS